MDSTVLVKASVWKLNSDVTCSLEETTEEHWRKRLFLLRTLLPHQSASHHSLTPQPGGGNAGGRRVVLSYVSEKTAGTFEDIGELGAVVEARLDHIPGVAP